MTTNLSIRDKRAVTIPLATYQRWQKCAELTAQLKHDSLRQIWYIESRQIALTNVREALPIDE